MTARTIILPLPPSLNNATFNLASGGRAKTPRYAAWARDAGWMLKIEPKWHVGGRVKLSIDLPQKMAGDIDNRVKPLADILVACRRIDDDRNVAELHVTKTWARPESCRVTVEAMP